MGLTTNPEYLLAHQDFVRALARHLVHDRDRADDVEQESWLRVLRCRRPREGSLRGWLASIVRNAGRDERRSDSRRARREAAAARPEAVPSTAAVVEREAVRREVVDAVLALPEPYRGVILLRFYETLPPRAIAARLGVPVETVRTQLKRGLAQLRAGLGIESGGSERHARALLALGAITVKTTSKLGLAAAALLVLAGVASPFLWETFLSPGRSRSSPSSPTREPAAAVVAEKPEAAVAVEGNPAPVAESAGAIILGQVVDVSGAPVPAARIVAHAPDAKGPFLPADKPPAGLDLGTSGEDGRFRIPVSPLPRSRRLFVEADGFAPGVADAICGEPVRVFMERGLTLAGFVRDAEEKPVAGARVKLAAVLGAVQLEREAVSAADGSYRIEGAVTERARQAGWRTWCIVVEAAGFAPLFTPAAEILRGVGAQELRFDAYLVRGATVTGRVVDAETGAALPDARVFLLSYEGSEDSLDDENPYRPRLLAKARSGASGEFRFANVPAEGPLPLATKGICTGGPIAGWVGAVVAGYCPGRACVVASPDGAQLDLAVKCWPAARVAGRVVDDGGRPHAGVRVGAYAGERWVMQLPKVCEGAIPLGATTDAAGRYVLECVGAPRGAAVEAVVSASAGQPPFSQAKMTVMVRAGETVEAPDLVLPRKSEPLVTVSVYDAESRPVSGATFRYPPNFPHRGGSGNTDASGRASFMLDGNPVYRHDWRVLVQAPGFAPAMSPPFIPMPDQATDVRVVLERGHRLTGRATWTDAQPAAGIAIYAIEPKHDPDAVLVWLFGKQPHELRELAEYSSTQTQLDGSFEVRVASGTAQRLLADNRTGPPATMLAPPDATDVTFVVGERPPVPEDSGGTIEGTVTDSGSRAAVLRFSVKIQAGEKLLGARRVGPGRFRGTAVPPGVVRLKVTAEGYPPVEHDVRVEAGKTASVAIALSRGVTLRGRVLVPSDVRMEGSMLVFGRSGTKEEIVVRPKADGAYEATGLAAGSYGVRFIEWDTMDRADHVCVPEDESGLQLTTEPQQTRDIKIVKGGSLSIHMRSGKVRELLVRREKDKLTPAEQEFLDAVAIEIRDGSGRVVRSSKFMQEATFGLPFGTYEVAVSVPGAKPKIERAVVDRRQMHVSFDLD